MTKVVIAQNSGTGPHWHVVNFLGQGKAEARGIVDLLAIRNSHTESGSPLKRGDLFEVVLIQANSFVASENSRAENRASACSTRAISRDMAAAPGLRSRSPMTSYTRMGSRDPSGNTHRAAGAGTHSARNTGALPLSPGSMRLAAW